jgi:hypothetical protein
MALETATQEQPAWGRPDAATGAHGWGARTSKVCTVPSVRASCTRTLGCSARLRLLLDSVTSTRHLTSAMCGNPTLASTFCIIPELTACKVHTWNEGIGLIHGRCSRVSRCNGLYLCTLYTCSGSCPPLSIHLWRPFTYSLLMRRLGGALLRGSRRLLSLCAPALPTHTRTVRGATRHDARGDSTCSYRGLASRSSRGSPSTPCSCCAPPPLCASSCSRQSAKTERHVGERRGTGRAALAHTHRSTYATYASVSTWLQLLMR